jgi:hypothetical protein
VLSRTFSPKARKTKLIEAWVPPQFGDSQEPYVGGPLPFSPRHALSLADCYLVFALVHDAERRDASRIDPFPSGGEEGLRFYHANLTNIYGLSNRDQLTLDDCLARVEADLSATGERRMASSPRGRSGSCRGEGEKPNAKRGRKPDTDPMVDKRVADAWGTGRYKTYEECGNALGMTKKDVKRAIDRDRHRPSGKHRRRAERME